MIVLLICYQGGCMEERVSRPWHLWGLIGLHVVVILAPVVYLLVWA